MPHRFNHWSPAWAISRNKFHKLITNYNLAASKPNCLHAFHQGSNKRWCCLSSHKSRVPLSCFHRCRITSSILVLKADGVRFRMHHHHLRLIMEMEWIQEQVKRRNCAEIYHRNPWTLNKITFTYRLTTTAQLFDILQNLQISTMQIFLRWIVLIKLT